ncbi:copia protein [Tanacetum coccineum]
MKIIGTKWVFRNKLDENGVVSRNKARLVTQGYNQQEGIDYDETYAPVARLESIRILLAYACALDFKLFQMDVKSAFLNGFINEEFEMSMMGELNFFLGLQIKQMEDGIFFNQSKYIKEMLKKFGLEDSKPMKTPMSSDTKLTKDEECESVDSTKYRGMIGTTHLGLWYPKGTGIETIVYADSDHAGDYVDRKSTSGICTFVGCCLTSWFSKKQTALAISTTEAEYVSAGKACQQALWMKQALIDYDNILDVPPRPLNPQPLQNLPSLDITLSLSPITPLENLSSPPSPSLPPPQPPIIGHPLYYNYHDYHGSTCICCFHNHNLYLNLREEMNIMFAHLEYLLTTAFTTHFPPPP